VTHKRHFAAVFQVAEAERHCRLRELRLASLLLFFGVAEV
jgi:hypothetical protein